jgi:hypothetical protein
VDRPLSKEKRAYQRIIPQRPIPARIGSARVYIVDLSVSGLRVAHQAALQPGQTFELTFDWEGRPVVLGCKVIHNTIFKRAKDDTEKSTYHAGLEIADAKGNSEVALREVITAHVMRALDEQKANARGIPALAAQSYQSGKGSNFLRCELVNGAWRISETSRPDQPLEGFTVSAEVDREQILLLCESWEKGDREIRRMIRIMAELSMSRKEGVPTRRYTP